MTYLNDWLLIVTFLTLYVLLLTIKKCNISCLVEDKAGKKKYPKFTHATNRLYWYIKSYNYKSKDKDQHTCLINHENIIHEI